MPHLNPSSLQHSSHEQGPDNMLICSVSNLLTRLSVINGPGSVHCSPVSCFHCTQLPNISIALYIARLHKYINASPSCFVMALVYCDRYLAATASSLSPFSVHRLYLTALVVAIKFSEDVFYKNSYYAKLGGVSLAEMNYLETQLLGHLSYRCYVSPEQYCTVERDLTYQYYMQQQQQAALTAQCSVPYPVSPCSVVSGGRSWRPYDGMEHQSVWSHQLAFDNYNQCCNGNVWENVDQINYPSGPANSASHCYGSRSYAMVVANR